MLLDGYRIRELDLDDAPALAHAYRRNRAHLEPWEPARDEAFYTEAGQRASISTLLAATRHGLTATWVLTFGEQVVGRFNLNNIVRGVLCSASLGYWVDGDHLRRGLAVAAVEHVCDQARSSGLHRMEAGTLLHNTASQRVLERCGFEAYGVAPDYLFLGGAWRAHRLYQRILHDAPL